jgi:hypothetical protein
MRKFRELFSNLNWIRLSPPSTNCTYLTCVDYFRVTVTGPKSATPSMVELPNFPEADFWPGIISG